MLTNKIWASKGLAFLAVVLAAITLPARASIVVNGDFETGTFSGWTVFGDPLSQYSFVVSDPPVPQSGKFGASFGQVETTAGMYQTLTTTPGALYMVDFWLQNEADPFGKVAPNSFDFSWGGVSEMSFVDAAAFEYTHYSFTLSALAANTDLRFSFRQDPYFFDIDNVAVTAAVPEPETWALFGAGLVGLMLRRRRQRTH